MRRALSSFLVTLLAAMSLLLLVAVLVVWAYTYRAGLAVSARDHVYGDSAMKRAMTMNATELVEYLRRQGGLP